MNMKMYIPNQPKLPRHPPNILVMPSVTIQPPQQMPAARTDQYQKEDCTVRTGAECDVFDVIFVSSDHFYGHKRGQHGKLYNNSDL